MAATIYSIVYMPEDAAYGETKGAYIRVPLEQATLVEGHGIQGDKKGRFPERQLNVISREWLEELSQRGFKTAPGEFGEQIILKGLGASIAELPPGTRIRLGSQAVIEVIKHRTGCNRLEVAQGRPVMTAGVGKLGILARVITGGDIRVGDPVMLVNG